MVREEKITLSPGVERHVLMLVARDARQRGARLALAAGAEHHHLVAAGVAKPFSSWMEGLEPSR